MIFTLDVLRARKGDCLVLHYGTEDDPGLILIDGGPSKVYTPHLQPRLAEIRNKRGLDDDATLPVDLLMVSHIDDDHINGILQMTKELVDAKSSGQPLPLKIRDLWHNTFDDIIGDTPKELLKAVTASFGAAALDAEPDAEGIEPAAARVLSSAGQGIRLRDDARFLKPHLRLNHKFGGKLVMAKKGGGAIDMGKGLQFTVAGPMEEELLALQKEHDAFLKLQEKEKTKKGALAAFTDTSAPNLSSLVLLAEVGGKKMLLTGDARGDKILKGLERMGLLEDDGKSKMHVDILKVPHHGSDRNMEPIFFRRVTADHYVFSGNGEHGNPERETLQMLLDERGDANITIHLTYPVEEIDVEREKDWNKEQKKELERQQKNPQLEVRKDWSHKKHSLVAFFEANEDFASKVIVVEKERPRSIDLLDKIGF